MSQDANPGEARPAQQEMHIRDMRKAVQRMKEDMARAPRKTNPGQYADSAINDAEMVIRDNGKIARLHLETMDRTTRHAASFRIQLDDADSTGAEAVRNARLQADRLSRAPKE